MCELIVCSVSFLHLVPFRVFLLSLLLPEPGPVPLPLPCGLHRGNIPLALRQMRSLALWPITRLSQVMSPTFSTISTTQRLLKSSSASNPATRCPRTCMTRNSVTRSLAERSPHRCSFRSAKNQRTVDKLITLLKKVCYQLSLCLSGHVRTVRPVNELSSLGSSNRENQVANQKMSKSGFSLIDKKKKQILPDCRAEIHKHEFQGRF